MFFVIFVDLDLDFDFDFGFDYGIGFDLDLDVSWMRIAGFAILDSICDFVAMQCNVLS